MTWIFRSVADAPRSPWELVKQNYDACTAAAPPSGRIELAFAELELRRRVHFALEVLLGAVKRTLSALEVADLPAIVRQWETTDLGQPDSALAPIVGCCHLELRRPLARFVADAGPGSFEKAWIAPQRLLAGDAGPAGAVRPGPAGRVRATVARPADGLPDPGPAQRDGAGVRVPRRGRRPPAPGGARGLLREQVVGRHLEVTLGKMGRGLGCSLRFYPEGSSLRPLGADVYGGLSALRLPNVFTMLADLGLLLRDDDWRYALTDTGKQLLAELDA
jgi:hypothetical protein